MNKNIEKIVNECIDNIGESRLEAMLLQIKNEGDESNATLTIIANAGIHRLPSELERGEVFIASECFLDMANRMELKNHYKELLSKLSLKLLSKTWAKIYLVPFGQCTFSMQIKLLVYRITRIETIDLVHVENGKYYDLDIYQRDIIANSK